MTPEMTPAQRHLRYLALSELADELGDKAGAALAYSPELADVLVEAAVALRMLAGDSWVRVA